MFRITEDPSQRALYSAWLKVTRILVIVIVSTYYILRVSWIIKSLITLKLCLTINRCKRKVFTCSRQLSLAVPHVITVQLQKSLNFMKLNFEKAGFASSLLYFGY